MTIALRAKTGAFDKAMKKSGKRVNTFARSVKGAMGALGIAAGAAGLGFFLRSAVTAAADFTKQMALVNTMLDSTSGKFMPEFTKAIRDLSVEFGQAKDVLAKGLFDILSAGIDASKALDVLTVATKAAIGGVSDTAVAVDGLTTVLNSYSFAADRATEVSDLMFKIVKEGKITFDELAENIGKLAPIAKAAGLTLNEMGAIIATVVKVEKSERAMTALRAALNTTAKAGKSLIQTVRELRGASLKTILDAGFTARSAVAISILTGNVDILNKELGIMAGKAGAADEAFRKMADTASQKISILAQKWENLKENVGAAAIAVVEFGAKERVNIAEIQRIGEERAGRGGPSTAEIVAGLDAMLKTSATERLDRLNRAVQKELDAAFVWRPIATISKRMSNYVRTLRDAKTATIAWLITAIKPLKKLVIVDKDIKEINKSLRVQVETYGQGANAAERYRLVVRGATAEMLKDFDALAASLKTLEKEATRKQLQTALADQIKEQVLTTLEIYERQLTQLGILLKAGAITWDEYGRAVRQAIEQRDLEKDVARSGEFRVINPDLINVAGMPRGGRDPGLTLDSERNAILVDMRRELQVEQGFR